MLPASALPWLVAIVLAAFAVEAALGFGATIVTVALGSLVVPIETLLPAFVPLNLVLSTWLVVRYRGEGDWRLLGKRMLPWMALGLPGGIVLFRVAGSGTLRGLFGVFVAILSASELVRAGRSAGRARLPPRGVRTAMLVLGGIVHGAFGTGGPLAVWVAGHELDDKRAFRSTLSGLWLGLNSVIVASWVGTGVLRAATLRDSARLGIALLVGLAIGEWAHRRVPARAFRTLVFAVLGATGVVLAVRAVAERAAPPSTAQAP